MTDLQLAVRSLRATPVVVAVADSLARARHRREHGDLLARQQPDAARAAGEGSRAARARQRREADGVTPTGTTRSGRQIRRAAGALRRRQRVFAHGPRQPDDRAATRSIVDGLWRADRSSTRWACPRDARTHVLRGRRSARRRARRTGGGHQLRLLAAPLRRRRRRVGQHAADRERAVHVVGVTPPDFFGPDVGRTFDVDRAARHRAALQPPREPARQRRRDVAQRDRAAQAGAVARDARRPRCAPSRRRSATPRRPPWGGRGARPVSEADVHARAGRHRRLVDARDATSAP